MTGSWSIANERSKRPSALPLCGMPYVLDAQPLSSDLGLHAGNGPFGPTGGRLRVPV